MDFERLNYLGTAVDKSLIARQCHIHHRANITPAALRDVGETAPVSPPPDIARLPIALRSAYRKGCLIRLRRCPCFFPCF